MSQPPTSRVLSHDITLACYDATGQAVDVPATLCYRPSDPYAIEITFHSGAGDVEWMVSRALLLEGMAGPAGDGDVKIFPSANPDYVTVTALDFQSPDGHLLTEAYPSELRYFLDRTFALVPAGAESDYLDLDSLIAELLDSAE